MSNGLLYQPMLQHVQCKYLQQNTCLQHTLLCFAESVHPKHIYLFIHRTLDKKREHAAELDVCHGHLHAAACTPCEP
jgi:hypothetical protein